MSYAVTVKTKMSSPGQGVHINIKNAPFLGQVQLTLTLMNVKEIRDEVVYSFTSSVNLNSDFDLIFELPSSVPEGAYMLAECIVVSEAAGDPTRRLNLAKPNEQVAHLAFWVKSDFTINHKPAAEHVAAVLQKRRQAIRTEINSTDSPVSFLFEVAYLYEGAAIRTQQNFVGYSIIPFGNGLPIDSFIKARDTFAHWKWGADFVATDADLRQFASEHPLAAIIFHQVRAISIEEALDGCAEYAHDVATALGLREMRPLR